ncbi:hypothetical protein AB0I53_25775 [Saccharopolyspora sp. NPDC050389]|uniref:hypothetical protein n=1 Tax=Saccharopolyspora sp. NPDC050389 TaxID=3155516 RepID=UPI003404422C
MVPRTAIRPSPSRAATIGMSPSSTASAGSEVAAASIAATGDHPARSPSTTSRPVPASRNAANAWRPRATATDPAGRCASDGATSRPPEPSSRQCSSPDRAVAKTCTSPVPVSNVETVSTTPVPPRSVQPA